VAYGVGAYNSANYNGGDCGVKKFPVTTEDGREFRVTIFRDDHYATVKLYIERKGRRVFRFKRVYICSYWRADGYDWKKPDFIALTAQAIADYDESVIYAAELRITVAQRDRDIAAAHTAFSAWDGKITEGG
jgi:hypothetical protein